MSALIKYYLAHASRLDQVTIAEKTYYRIPGRVGELGGFISWDGCIYNVETQRLRKWSLNRGTESDTRKTWTVSFTCRTTAQTAAITKVRALAEVFIPKPSSNPRHVAVTEMVDDKHDCTPLDIKWGFSHRRKRLESVRRIKLDDKTITVHDTLSDALIALHAQTPVDEFKMLALRMGSRLRTQIRNGYKTRGVIHHGFKFEYANPT